MCMCMHLQLLRPAPPPAPPTPLSSVSACVATGDGACTLRSGRFAVRTERLRREDSNLLQGLDIDESLGLEHVDEQIRDYLSQKAVRVIDLFRQWDDDGTGKIEKPEFCRGMKELGLTVSKAQLDELFDMWDPDKSGARLAPVPKHDTPCVL